MAPERRTARLIAALTVRLSQWIDDCRRDVSSGAAISLERTAEEDTGVSCYCRLHRICDTFKDMKTSTLPPLRVEPRLRSQAERLLRAGETLSSFIVDAVEERVRNRAMEGEFIKRGLASAEKARRSGKYTPAAQVVAGLRRRLDDARKAGSRRPGRKARRTR